MHCGDRLARLATSSWTIPGAARRPGGAQPRAPPRARDVGWILGHSAVVRPTPPGAASAPRELDCVGTASPPPDSSLGSSQSNAVLSSIRRAARRASSTVPSTFSRSSPSRGSRLRAPGSRRTRRRRRRARRAGRRRRQRPERRLPGGGAGARRGARGARVGGSSSGSSRRRGGALAVRGIAASRWSRSASASPRSPRGVPPVGAAGARPRRLSRSAFSISVASA